MNDVTKPSRRALLGVSAASSAAGLIGLETVRSTATARAVDPTIQATQTVQSVETALYTASNTTFGTAHVSGSYADCAVVFTAPETGRVLVHWSGAPRNTAASNSPVAYLSPEVRSGGSVGSGSVVLGANDRRSVRSNLAGSHTVRAGASHLVTGLTPGSTYNARILHRVTSQSGEFFHRGLIVEPLP